MEPSLIKSYEQRLLVKLGTESPETIFSQIDACLDTLGSAGEPVKLVRKTLESKLELWNEAHAVGVALKEQMKEMNQLVDRFFRP